MGRLRQRCRFYANVWFFRMWRSDRLFQVACQNTGSPSSDGLAGALRNAKSPGYQQNHMQLNLRKDQPWRSRRLPMSRARTFVATAKGIH